MNRCLVLLLIAVFFQYLTPVPAFNVVDEIVGFVLEKRQENNDTTAISSTTRSPPATTPTIPSTTIVRTSDNKPTTTEPVLSTTARSNSPKSTFTPPTTSTTETPTTTEIPTTEHPTPQPTTIRITTQTSVASIGTFTISGTQFVSTVYIHTTIEIQPTAETSTVLSQPSSTGSGNNGGGGISTSARNTIVGVVVGVGGAIIIGALLIVGFRLRRKKSGAGFDDGIRDSPSSTNPMRQQDAFKATLDQYHKPPGTVNPSANF